MAAASSAGLVHGPPVVTAPKWPLPVASGCVAVERLLRAPSPKGSMPQGGGSSPASRGAPSVSAGEGQLQSGFCAVLALMMSPSPQHGVNCCVARRCWVLDGFGLSATPWFLLERGWVPLRASSGVVFVWRLLADAPFSQPDDPRARAERLLFSLGVHTPVAGRLEETAGGCRGLHVVDLADPKPMSLACTWVVVAEGTASLVVEATTVPRGTAEGAWAEGGTCGDG
mmetsp:Transcript_55415/g.161802  ORF Transcript_55415/g.161802 Transcript_55415/m.161802 type:complete len:227 (-) Transcript_55415:1441-2121(-)